MTTPFRYLTILFIPVILAMMACEANTSSQSQNSEMDVENSTVMQFDSAAAIQYGADPYGMRKYVMAFLKKGPNRDQDSITAAELQTAHLKNIGRLAEEGKLVVAGPFLDTGEIRGIYVFAVETIAEAEALTKSDPAVQAGRLVMELKEWYGSAALMATNDIHGTLSRRDITE